MSEKCPQCGNTYKMITAHWTRSSNCAHPEISKEKKELIQGLLMGDASVEDRGSSGRMGISVTNKDFLLWIDEKLEHLSNGVKNYYTSEEQKERVSDNGTLPIEQHHDFDTPYELKTKSHPYFKKLRSWYGSNGKRFPEDLELTPLKAKMWYCCDGSLICSKKQRPHARFYTKNENDRLDVLVDYFHQKGLDGRKYEGSVGFTAEETIKLLDWMGDPPPGMNYKWVN